MRLEKFTLRLGLNACLLDYVRRYFQVSFHAGFNFFWLTIYFSVLINSSNIIHRMNIILFTVTLSFAPKRSSGRTFWFCYVLFCSVLSDERLGAKLRVSENRCVLVDSFTYIYPALLPQHRALYAKVDSTPIFI